MAKAAEHGLTQMIVPALVKPEAMEGTGFLGAHAAEVYKVDADDLYLVGTSEVALAAYHSDEILDLSAGPKRYAGFSPCFRREAGSYGKDTRGVFRVHWFDKVEMFSFCRPEEAEAEHRGCSAGRRSSCRALELPFQVLDIAAGDLGSSAARKFDCEAWFPSQERYRELTSTSNCGTFQARRLNIRYRDEAGKPQIAGDPERHAVRGHPDHRLPAGGAPAAGRVDPGPGRAAARGWGAGRCWSRSGEHATGSAATDLDGTLIRSDGTVSRRTCEAMHAAEAAGIVLALVTGRPPRWMAPVARGDRARRHRGLRQRRPALRPAHRDRAGVLAARRRRAAAGRAALRAVAPGLTFAAEYAPGFGHEPGYRHGWDLGLTDVRVGPAEQILDRPAGQAAGPARDDGRPDELLALAVEVLGAEVAVTSSSREALLEISAPGRHQGDRAGRAGGRAGIPPTRWSRSGTCPTTCRCWPGPAARVAVANAHPEVLALADEVTASNDDDGVALVLERAGRPRLIGSLCRHPRVCCTAAVAVAGRRSGGAGPDRLLGRGRRSGTARAAALCPPGPVGTPPRS